MIIHIHISTLRGTFHEYTSKLILLILQFIVKREKKTENLTSALLLKVGRINEEQLNNSIFCSLSLSLIMN